MRRLFPLFLCAAVALGRLGASGARPFLAENLTPEWRIALDGIGFEARRERSFHAEAGEIVVDGRVGFEPKGRTLWVEGVYRTRQLLDPRAKLSYQLLTDEGRLLRFEGTRFDWRECAGGGREADFRIEIDQWTAPGLQPVFRVQFNYVVEGQFWYHARYPEVFLPQLAVRGPARPAQFGVRWAWVPSVLPAGTACVIPVWIRAEFAGAARPYSAAMDVLTTDGANRVETLRQPVPLRQDGEALVFYRLNEDSGRSVRLRPGFVWEGVEWFDAYSDNPYREVWLVGPLVFAVGLSLAGLGLAAAWSAARRLKTRWRRRVALMLWGGAALGLVCAAVVSLYGIIALGLALAAWLQRRIAEPGPRAYWTAWALLVLLDLFWGHLDFEGRGSWTGSLLSACLAALVFVPLRWIRRPVFAAVAGTGIGGLATLVAMTLAVYFSFFRDYPGLRDLLYAGQVGEVGDSLAALIGQRHLVPWWLWACASVGLWRR